MFLVPDVLPYRKHTSIVPDVVKLRVCGMLVSSKAMCFLIAILSLNTFVQIVRRLLLLERRNCLLRRCIISLYMFGKRAFIVHYGNKMPVCPFAFFFSGDNIF